MTQELNARDLAVLRTLARCAAYAYGRADRHGELEIPEKLRVTAHDFAGTVSKLDLLLLEQFNAA